EDLRAFEQFFKNLDGQLSWQNVDTDVIRDWMESMVDKGNSATSVHRRLSALRSFYRFALAHQLVERDPAHQVECPKEKKALPQFMREDEMDRLLDDIEWGAGYQGVLDRTIIMTFYQTGIRLSELIGLTDAAIDLPNRQLKVTGKGNKQRVVPFGDELAKCLQRYACERNRLEERCFDAFFVSHNGCKLTPQQVRKIVRMRLAAVSTAKKRSPHVLRHTFATAMLNHGAGIESVRRLLGHASASTTEIYTHTTFEQLKRIYHEAHPRA
ncbi:tyrosine-type recombinase/integrase, partial [Hallella sp.]